MTEIAGPLSGLSLEEAKKKVNECLKEKNLILKTTEIPAKDRMVNTHERCGTPVEFLIHPQWFIKVVENKEKILSMGRKLNWYPEFMRSRLKIGLKICSGIGPFHVKEVLGSPFPLGIRKTKNMCMSRRWKNCPWIPRWLNPKSLPKRKMDSRSRCTRHLGD